MRMYFRLRDFKARLRSGDSLYAKELESEYVVQDDSSSFSLRMPKLALGDNSAAVDLKMSPARAAVVRASADVDLKSWPGISISRTSTSFPEPYGPGTLSLLTGD